MIVDLRKQQREHPSPIHIDGTVVEKVERFKFFGVHIMDKLKWSTHTDSVVKKAQQRLFNLKRLKKCVVSSKTLRNVYRCTLESILSGCITAWYGNCTVLNRKSLQRVVRSTPQHITGGANYLPSRTPTAPNVTGTPKRSSRTTITRATACSPRCHLEGEGTMFVAFVCFAVASRPKYIAATCMEFVITFSLLLLYTLKLNKKLTLFFWPLVDLFNSLFAAVFILILSLLAVSTYTVTGTLGGGIVGFIATDLWCVDGYMLFKRVTFNQPRTAATGTVK
uniref:MARVEL domain-containing protein n=1 Tax=Oncorhynchus tshawytscha TaxID=74940 RepID=A0AAZ3P044_ONCTS